MTALLSQLEHILAPWDAVDSVNRTTLGGDVHTLDQRPPVTSSMDVPVTFLPSTASPPTDMNAFASAHAPPGSGPHLATSGAHTNTSLFPASLCDARQRTTKLELARAALAVFVSNAGVFRPILQKTLTFVFQYVDFLIDERSLNVLELATARHASTQRGDASRNAQGGEMEGVGSSGAEDDAVASAHQRVRLVEAKMAALVEEASAQRDRFKAQIAAHEQQAKRLEALLVHQMELTQMLLHDKAVSSGGAGVTAHASPLTDLPASVGGGGGGGVGGQGSADALVAAAYDRAHATTSLWSDEAWAQHDRNYVRQLISRAEKEKLVSDLEEHVARLKAERNQIQTKVQDLLGLNARYARQAVELSARMSIIHDQNIALSTDVQLFQRDTLREQQRAGKLSRDLTASRHMLLTLLEVRAQELQTTMLANALAAHAMQTTTHTATSASTRLPSLEANTALLIHAAGAPRALIAAEESALAPPGGAGQSRAGTTAATSTIPYSFVTDAKSPSLEDDDLRAQLEELLLATANVNVDGVEAAAGGRSVADYQQTQRTLEKVLLLRQATAREPEVKQASAAAERAAHTAATNVTQASPSASAGAVVPVVSSILRLPVRLWVAPCGKHTHVPLHLRSSSCIRLLPLHPLVAESYVQELISQRMELRLFLRRRYQRDIEEKAALQAASAAQNISTAALMRQNRWALFTSGGVKAVRGSTSAEMISSASSVSMTALVPNADAAAAALTMTPLDAYICLFVRILWLNEEDIFYAHLPEDVRSAYALEKAPTTHGTAAASATSMASPHSPRDRMRSPHAAQLDNNNNNTGKSVPSPPNPTDKQRACLTAPLNIPHELYVLPPSALRLTYSLDVLSRGPEAGFLTYAYGWTSRRLLSEVIFDVMEAERRVFLRMCYQADKLRERLKASRRAEARRRIRDERKRQRQAQLEAVRERQAAEAAQSASVGAGRPSGGKKTKKAKATTSKRGRGASPPTKPKEEEATDTSVEKQLSEDEEESQEDAAPSCAGCLPLVQIARILATMYPSYRLEKLEQLVLAAAADGTDGAECPVMVYYGVLLPDRLLPGSAGTTGSSASRPRDSVEPPKAKKDRNTNTHAAELPTSASVMWRCGTFASLFFSHVCDDALEAMSRVEDSLLSMADILYTSRSDHPHNTASTSDITQPQRTSIPGKADDSPSKASPRGDATARDTPQTQGSPRHDSVPVDAVEATETQISALGFTGLPLEQMHAWSTALRSVLHHWPRLQSRLHNTNAAATAGMEPPSVTTPRTSITKRDAYPSSARAANSLPTSTQQSPATRPLSERSGGSSGAAGTPTEEALTSAVAVPRVAIREVIAYLREHLLLRRGPHKPSSASMTSMKARLPVEAVAAVHARDCQHWCPCHAAYIDVLQGRWNAAHGVKEGNTPRAGERGPANLITVAEDIAAEVGAEDSSSFFAWLRQLDPRREAVWGDDVVASINTILRAAEDIDDTENSEEDESGGGEVGVAKSAALTTRSENSKTPQEGYDSARTPGSAAVNTQRMPTPPPEPRTKNTTARSGKA